jgi:hypothetical protein
MATDHSERMETEFPKHISLSPQYPFLLLYCSHVGVPASVRASPLCRPLRVSLALASIEGKRENKKEGEAEVCMYGWQAGKQRIAREITWSDTPALK